jgi:eukaryotic-like serine/threonine-protein kinase
MSGQTDRARVEAVFEAALELGADARSAFVTAACGDDVAMRRAVLALLAGSARTRGVLERAPPAPAHDAPPERLGVYRVLREIGRGGMGVVYDAERDDGQFRRRVAVKIMRPDSDPELRQRVLAERQILAALDHPCIARLLDGGLTTDGRPYLVMEHVDGLPVDVYCDRMRLTVAERLRLFCEVARAVEHAHRSLVVHRDLKPSNILVTADGRLKLLDFGIAKLLNPWVHGAGPPMTRDRLALTPEYASPEQLQGDAVTTGADVYSLGVVLYELMTGRRPFAQHEASPARHIAAVCSSDPEPASARVLRAETIGGAAAGSSARCLDPAAVAAARQTTPQRLAHGLRGDLDAITAMALRPEPGRRYGSAELLAQDVERHLADERVQAHAGTRAYALRKLVRRHRVEAAAAVLVSASLLAGAGASMWQARAALAARAQAEVAVAESTRITEFLLALFEAGAPEATLAGAVTARDIVERGVARIGMLQEQPAVQASLLAVLGQVLGSLAEYEDAQRLTERALALHEAAGDETGLARMLAQRGTLQRQRGDYRQAQQTLLQALALQRRVLGPADASLGATYHQLAGIAVYLGELQDAERHAEEGYEIHRAALGETHRLTLNSLLLRGVVQRRLAQHDEAERTMRQVIARRPLAGGSTRAEAMEDRLQLADLLTLRGRADEAERTYRDILAEARSTPDEFAARGRARHGLATLLARRGDLADAELLRREAHEEQRAIYGASHRAVAQSASALAAVLLSRGQLDSAEHYYREAAMVFRSTVGERHLAHANALAEIAAIHLQRGSYAAADSLLVHAMALRTAGEGPNAHGMPDLMRRRAEVHIARGRFEDAEETLQQALSDALARGYSPGAIREIHRTLAQLFIAWSRPADAAPHAALGIQP